MHQSFWASGFWASLDDNPYKLDPEKAKALLTEAGYPDGFSIDLDAPNSSPFTNIAQSVQATMAQGGVKVNIVSSETKALLTKYRARQHQVLMIYWGPDYMDPHTNADGFANNLDNSDEATKGKPLAWRNSWTDDAVNKMTAAAVRERDEAKRKQMYLDLQKKVLDEGPYAIMFQSTSQVATRANVKDFIFGPVVRRRLLQPDDQVRRGSAVPGYLDRRRAARLMQERGPFGPRSRPAEIITYAAGAFPGVATFWRRAGAAFLIVPADESAPLTAIVGDLQAASFAAQSGIADVRSHRIWVETDRISLLEPASRTQRHGLPSMISTPASACLRDVLAERGCRRAQIGLELGFVPAADFSAFLDTARSTGVTAPARRAAARRQAPKPKSPCCAALRNMHRRACRHSGGADHRRA